MSRESSPLPLHFLRPGDRIAIVAPSGRFERAELEAGIAALRERYDVRHAPDLFETEGFFAGSDARRLRELRSAIEDDDVRAIVAARGGYGATRLLPELPASLVAAHPKLLVGFSDITALHALWARAGVGSIHGPMAATLGRVGGTQLERFVAAVEGRAPRELTGLTTFAGGLAAGRLSGGNLAVLAALVGTAYALPVRGAVLFLEDVGERPYRVDRMLTTLRQAGMLSELAGVALGAFTDAAPGPDGVTVESVLRERLGELGVPVVAGVPAGHVDDNHPLLLGARVSLDADAGSLRYEPTA